MYLVLDILSHTQLGISISFVMVLTVARSGQLIGLLLDCGKKPRSVRFTLSLFFKPNKIVNTNCSCLFWLFILRESDTLSLH